MSETPQDAPTSKPRFPWIMVAIGAVIAVIISILSLTRIELGGVGALVMIFFVLTWIGVNEMRRTKPGDPVSPAAPIIGCFSALMVTAALSIPSDFPSLQIAMVIVPSLSMAILVFAWSRYHRNR